MRFEGTIAAVVVVAAAAITAGACSTSDDASGGSPFDAGADAAPAALCADGEPVTWPPGPYDVALTSTLPPDLVFESPDGPVRLADYFEPCAPRSRLLVLRATAMFCGTCLWHAEHTRRIFDDPAFAGRVELLDLLVSDEDNMPAGAAAWARWKARVDAPGKVAIDTKLAFQGSLLSPAPLPHYVVIDTRTMTVRFALGNPDPESLKGRLRVELAELDHLPSPAPAVPSRYDDLLTEDQWDLVQGMRLPGAPPPDSTNEYADDVAAAALGEKLFSDTLLSPSNTVSCATCHDPAKAFQDGKAQATGVSVGDRSSPAVALAAHARWQFWDGRADTLWMQALGPFENDKEFASSRLFVAQQIASRYAAEYAAVFTKHPLPDLGGLPANGKPGDPEWGSLTLQQQDAVTRVYVNVGKAIAAFERTIRLQPNALDRYAGGDKAALSSAQKEALLAFMVNGCAQCHFGPRLTDDAFHVIRFPTGRQDHAPDRGRIDVLPGLASAEFVASSKWSDAPAAVKLLTLPSSPTMAGAFKTPTLRGLPQSAPYGHGGSFATLLEVAKHYGTRAKDVGDGVTEGSIEPWLSNFDENVQAKLPTFLEILDGNPEP
jgi:cytochrome c peroxidase